MSRWFIRLGLIVLGVLAFPHVSPAPLTYVPGEGWTYEAVGSQGRWQRTRATEQYEVAKTAFDQRDISTASKAAHRVVRMWPQSDSAPQAQFLIGRCYEIRRMDERAFNAYQDLLAKYPKVENYDEVLKHQFDIAARFLGGQRFKLWNYIPLLSSMDKTSDMFSKIVTNGPYSDYGQRSQLAIGTAREKQKDYVKAVKAYEVAVDRYSSIDQVNAEAIFRAGLAYQKQARKAEYDQGTAAQAISTFTDFITLHPSDSRVSQATNIIRSLKAEQALGNFKVAGYYESNRRWEAARIYYNEVLVTDPNSPYADTARSKIESLNQRLGTTNRPTAQPLTDGEPRPPRATASTPTEPSKTETTAAPTPAPAPKPIPVPVPAPKPVPPPIVEKPVPPDSLPESKGYKLGPTGGRIAGAESIQVLPFENKTMEPRLTDALTTALRRDLQQDGTYKLRTDGEADLIVSGTISDYKRTELTLARSDLLSVRDYQVLMTANVKVVQRSTDRVILERPFNGWTIMRLGNDLSSLEREMVPELAGDLARNITAAITEGTW